MAAVVRLKRRADDSPLEALLINTKVAKYDSDCEKEESQTTLLNFVGTVNSQGSQEEDVKSLIKHLKTKQTETLYKTHQPNIKETLKKEFQKSSIESRYKIINYLRFNGSVEDNLTILDIEAKNETNNDKTDYVYDLFYTKSDDLIDPKESEEFSICPINDLVFGDELYEESDDDSQDSNVENYFTNDYPDEDDIFETTDEEREASSDDNFDDFEYYLGHSREIDDYDYEQRFQKFTLQDINSDNNEDEDEDE